MPEAEEDIIARCVFTRRKNMITAIMFNRTGVRDERFLDKVDWIFLEN
jgi:hypothetical protein